MKKIAGLFRVRGASHRSPALVAGPPRKAVDCRLPDGVLSLFLFVITALAFLPALRNAFVFDDIPYITANERVRAGLSWEGIVWAFTSVYRSNWHPLTWLSHMLDVELFGLEPWGHHLVNLLLHAANAVLVFALCRRATGARWRSFFVAALFAVHPLRVESVAWAAERKDVLSELFGLLAVLAYLRGRNPARRRLHALAAAFFVLSLLAKPTFVTLPLLLLLLDYWPLARLHRSVGMGAWFPLLREKAPLFLIAMLSSAAAIAAQGSVRIGFQHFSPTDRILNAFLSLSAYLGRTVRPTRLEFFYPIRPNIPVRTYAVAILVVAAVTIVALRLSRRLPYLAVGWFWYLIALLPMIGLVQVGTQASADRYTYLPSIGLGLAVVWLCCEPARSGFQRLFVAALGAVAVAALFAATLRQVQVWKDNKTLFQSALAVDPDNYLAHYNLAIVLSVPETADQALAHFREAVRLRPSSWPARLALARELDRRGNAGEAAFHLRRLVRLEPENPEVHREYGEFLLRRREYRAAEKHLRQALRLQPSLARVREMLALCREEEVRNGLLRSPPVSPSAGIPARK